MITISAKPEFDSPLGEFELKDSIQALPSVPVRIQITPSKFGIGSNFQDEVFLTARLTNKDGKLVSSGAKVRFDDVLPGQVTARGRFREQQTVTQDSAKVSSFYSADVHPIGTQIKLRVFILNQDGSDSGIGDSTYLNINL